MHFVNQFSCLSLPTRERGLKDERVIVVVGLARVAPYAGAWIESSYATFIFGAFCVAPYAGAWIESRWEILAIK